jgi:hypothetical protein
MPDRDGVQESAVSYCSVPDTDSSFGPRLNGQPDVHGDALRRRYSEITTLRAAD